MPFREAFSEPFGASFFTAFFNKLIVYAHNIFSCGRVNGFYNHMMELFPIDALMRGKNIPQERTECIVELVHG